MAGGGEGLKFFRGVDIFLEWLRFFRVVEEFYEWLRLFRERIISFSRFFSWVVKFFPGGGGGDIFRMIKFYCSGRI